MNIIAVLRTYNNEDIIAQTLRHLRCNGISFVVMDGGSTDHSVEIVRSFTGDGLLSLNILPRNFFTMKDYDIVIEMAGHYSPDWILVNDADEFYEAPELGKTLCDAITNEAKRGFNVIQFDHFQFWMTEKDFESQEVDIQKKLRYYAWNDDFRYKAWKYYPGTTVSESGSHVPKFPNDVRVRLAPHKFVMRHYPLRSLQQANRKVFTEMLPRFDPREHARGLNVHYDNFKPGRQSFVKDSSSLHYYNGDGKWIIPSDHRKTYNVFLHDSFKHRTIRVVRELLGQRR